MRRSINYSFCKLCLTEKLWNINFIIDENMLNKESELKSKCRHSNKDLLKECQ